MCHSFIVGDLVIDHTIFVKDTTADHQPKANENIFQVLRRTDTAGGAANCARILAALSDGETFLWGITGRSPWGQFRSILSHAQAVDGSTNAIEFRGVADETDGQMNTISRLILGTPGQPGGSLFKDRFDEYRHLHVTPEKRKTVLHYLERACRKLENQSKGHLDVIVVNDLDYGCLTKEIVTDISEFAQRQQAPISLFVDPKYDAEKYRYIKGKAILPNLKEWCRLVGQREHETEWRNRVRQSRDLSDMAYLCFLTFGDFEYYIITCDEDGVVFIGPSMETAEQDRYIVCKIPPHAPSPQGRLDQLGSGDVLTAIFAMELDRIARSDLATPDTERALKALIRASIVVACYREMPWHHMPSRGVVKKALMEVERDPRYDSTSASYVGKPKAHPRAGMKYLPKDHKIVLSEYNTIVPGWFSKSKEFREQLQKLIDDCLAKEWEKHIVLGAPSGCGKSAFRKFLRRKAAQVGIEYREASKPDDIQTYTRELSKGAPNEGAHSIFVIDEALKYGFRELKFALKILEESKARAVRLLLIDTGFFENSPLDEPKNFEIKRRVTPHFFLSPDQRPFDVPLIIAGLILERLTSVEIRGDFLLGFTCGLLHIPSVGDWKPEIDKTVLAAMTGRKSEDLVTLSGKDIPPTVRKLYLDDLASQIAAEKTFTFSRGAGWPLLPTVLPETSDAKGDVA